VLRLLPEPSTTRHVINLGERSIAFTASAGTLPLRDAKGETTAEIFHVAYATDPPSPDRPITFVSNGGPGAASAFLHLGAVGPRLIAFSEAGAPLPPPARLVDNPDTWLDFTDLVFVDPVGTGYSRPAEEGKEADGRFLGVRQDASAMAAFIRLYLARAGRAASPVFLVGESYGGFRAAALTRVLPEEAGVAPSGAVLISPALELSLLRGEDYELLPWATALPSMAAVHLERQGTPEGEFTSRLVEVERFALTDYLVALAAGPAGITPAIEAALIRATGLPAEVVARSRGRISVSRFIKEYDHAGGRVLSRYDGTADGPDPDPRSPRASGPDPVLDRAVPVWTSAFISYVREELGYRTDLTYHLLNRDIRGRWDYGTTPNRQGYAGALDDLRAGRVLNPSLQVLVAAGYTDLVTPYFASRYLLGQLIPLAGAAPIAFGAYPGGHMMYMRPGSRRALATDARALYRRALAAMVRNAG
jgi:carboxypeptidase C (cathepsin A)